MKYDKRSNNFYLYSWWFEMKNGILRLYNYRPETTWINNFESIGIYNPDRMFDKNYGIMLHTYTYDLKRIPSTNDFTLNILSMLNYEGNS